MYYDVAEFEFEDLGLETHPGIYCGLFSGVAHLDEGGAVVAITVDGYREGKSVRDRLEVDRFKGLPDWLDRFAAILADEIKKQFKDEIEFTMTDWRESAGIREYEVAE